MIRQAIFMITGLLLIIFSAVPALAAATAVPANPPVRSGIDNIDRYAAFFQGKRVGLITNPTGINSQYQSTVDVLQAKTNLVALFAPEHGLRGNIPAGANISSYVDAKTGLTVFSLYGSSKKPTPDMLADVDVLAFDIQDIGARSYTYIYTMAYAMQACKENDKTFVVFDRPNPVGGEVVEGNILNPEFSSFIGLYPLPIRHGMTVGELAQLFNEEFGIGCRLVVVKMTGWKRWMYYGDTGLPWVMPSPNIPTPDSALLYPATGILDGTNISVGVGTTRPFELVGTTWLDAAVLADRMNGLQLPGVYFRPASFTPAWRKDQQPWNGVQIHVLDRRQFRAVRTGISLLYVIRDLGGDHFVFSPPYREGARPMIDLGMGDSYIREGTYTLEQVLERWDRESREFQERSRRYYLYD